MVTLTYDKENERGYFRKRDYQNFVRLMKKQGHRIRYVITGERGSKGGRVHWHMLIFWYSKPWLALLSTRNVVKHWYPHGHYANKRGYPTQGLWKFGHMVVEPVVDWKGIAYVTKYMLKDHTYERDSYFACSHNIGTAWICGFWAQQYVNQGLCPDKKKAFATYAFAEDRLDPKGAWRYRMAPIQAARFAKALDEKWSAQRSDLPPKSEAFFHFLEKWDNIWLREEQKVPFRPEPARDSYAPPPEYLNPKLNPEPWLLHQPAPRKSEHLNAFYRDTVEYGREYWRWGPHNGPDGQGGYGWHAGKLKSRQEVERQLQDEALAQLHGPPPLQHSDEDS